MTVRLGYLLPTRENIMLDRPGGRPLLDAARLASDLGYDSVWAGDSLLARPRHDPLTLLAAVAGAVRDVSIGTAVLLPALRNPVVLAQQLATIDQVSEGRLIVGVGIAGDMPAVRDEFLAAGVDFAARVGRLTEGLSLCRALWQGQPVSWNGRWQVVEATLAPVPWRPGGPPIWMGTGSDAGIDRTARLFDGWFPIGPDAATFASRRARLTAAAIEAGRDPGALATAIYLTVAVDDDADAADAAINDYLQHYYHVPATAIRRIQACFGGRLDDVLAFVRGFTGAGAEHVVIRIVGDHDRTLRALAARRDEMG